ncbi:hypothetical protein GLOIN_2v1768858 [Rhizophagus clarus]|uniref:C2H2-type domain-containing protein n=1 Tax=Rhizophagus clarus TaxID=94130 RepID=A0A8H3LJP9_9GLOM|nr:hypothetical protein GLOIN_2v1768858 [Rhizophagus clarus]
MSFKYPFCPRYFSTRSAYAQHKNFCTPPYNESSSSEELEKFEDKVSDHDIEMVYEEVLFDNKSVDSENDQSFQSIMSILGIDEIDQNIEEINQNENVIKDILEDSGSELNEKDFKAKINMNYPNEAYGDLMSLVTKYKLSNVTGNAIIKFFNKHANLDKSPLLKSIEQGRKYMDNMKLPSLILIKNILSISDILQNFALTFEKVEHNGERKYSEQNIGIWWENIEKSLPDAKFLSLILYSDVTNIDILGKSQLHPIYLSIGNIKNWRRNKQNAKQLLSEAATYCLTYKSSMSNYSCYFCLVTRDNLADFNLQINDIKTRTHLNMQQYFNQNAEKSVCIENISNFFWKLPDINIYQATVSDRLHYLDLGLFHYQIEYTKKLLEKQCEKSLVDEIDNRLIAIPRFSGLKIFINGIQILARLVF